MAKNVVLDAFCWIKNTKIDFGRGFAPDPTGLAYTAPPDLLVGGGAGASCFPSPITLPRLGSSGFELRPFGLGFSVPRHFWLPSAAHYFEDRDHGMRGVVSTVLMGTWQLALWIENR